MASFGSRLLNRILLGACLLLPGVPVLAQSPQSQWESLNEEAANAYREGRYEDAAAFALRQKELAAKLFGQRSVSFTIARCNLGAALGTLRRFEQAFAELEACVTALDAVKPPLHAELARQTNNLASIYRDAGRNAEAERHFRSALQHARHASPDGSAADTIVPTIKDNLATLYRDQGRFAEAERLFAEAHALWRALAPDTPEEAMNLAGQARLVLAQRQFARAADLAWQALQIQVAELNVDHPHILEGLTLYDVALTRSENKSEREIAARVLDKVSAAFYRAGKPLEPFLTVYGSAMGQAGRYQNAELIFTRLVELLEKQHNPQALAGALFELAGIKNIQSKYRESQPILERIVALRETDPRGQSDVAWAVHQLAVLHGVLGDHDLAGRLYERSLSLIEIGSDAYRTFVLNFAQHNLKTKRWAEADRLLREVEELTAYSKGRKDRALTTLAKAEYFQGVGDRQKALQLARDAEQLAVAEFGEHSIPANSARAQVLGLLIGAQRFAEARPLIDGILDDWGSVLGPHHPTTKGLHAQKGAIFYSSGEWANAMDSFRQALDWSPGSPDGSLLGELDGQAARERSVDIAGFVRSAWRLRAVDKSGEKTTFLVAQAGSSSSAARALLQMATRYAGARRFAELVREKQDLETQLAVVKTEVLGELAQDRLERSDKLQVARLRREGIESSLHRVNAQLAQEAHETVAIGALSLEEAQRVLGADEALVLFLDTAAWGPLPEETFVWVATKSQVRWLRSELGTAALQREVVALRCGLDATAWDGKGAQRCADLL
jgi:tetratricopeptide (TPR) repeat protein